MAKRRSKKQKNDDLSIGHGTLIKWVNESEDTTLESRNISEKCRNYYDSIQFTDSEAQTLSARGQPVIVVNRFKPKMDGLFGMEKGNRTTAKALPRTPQHTSDADAATEAIRYVLDDNFYPQVRSAVFENICIEGTGGCEVIVKPDDEKMRICVRPIFWDRLIYDPHSRRKDFSDARYLGQVVWMDYDLAVADYPDGKDVLEDMLGSNSTTYDDKPRWMDTTRNRVKIVELYWREAGGVKYACFTRGGFLKAPMDSPYVNEEGETEWPYEFQSAFVSMEGERYGPGKQLLDVQDEINKRRSKALHLMSVRQIRLERGAVEDVNSIRKELARPDGVIETTPGMEFEVLKTGDMAQAQFSLLAEAKQEIDAVGFNAAVSGKLEGSQSGRALSLRQQAGQTELSPIFDGLRYFDLRVYRKVWNRVVQYWTEEKWIRVTDDERNIKFVGINQPLTKADMMIAQARDRGADDAQIEMLKMQLQQDPSASEVVQVRNSPSELDVDIILSDAPDVPSMEVEQFQGLAEVIKSGAPPVLIEALIETSTIPHKQRVLRNLRGETEIPQQVKAQMDQMQQQMQQLAQENQQLKTGAQQDMAKLQADSAVEQEKLRLQAISDAETLRLQREKAFAELELKRDVAFAELALQEQIERAKLRVQTENQPSQVQ